jgi:hypothetical protein
LISLTSGRSRAEPPRVCFRDLENRRFQLSGRQLVELGGILRELPSRGKAHVFACNSRASPSWPAFFRWQPRARDSDVEAITDIEHSSSEPSAPCCDPLARKSMLMRSPIWDNGRRDPSQSAKAMGWLCMEHRVSPIAEIDLPEIIPGRGLHIRNRQESWLISLPEDLQSDEWLRPSLPRRSTACRGSCEPCES